jgi:hypothetical protein
VCARLAQRGSPGDDLAAARGAGFVVADDNDPGGLLRRARLGAGSARGRPAPVCAGSQFAVTGPSSAACMVKLLA